MPTERYIYYSLMVLAVFLCYLKIKFDKTLVYILCLLTAGILTEVVGEYFKDNNPKFRYLPYHIYIPIEYMLATFYMSTQISLSNIKRVMLWSIPFFVLASTITSLAKNTPLVLPALQYNLGGFLIIIWSLLALFNLPIKVNGRGIFSFPVFWLSAGYLFLFTGQFFMNGFYNYLLSKIEKTQLEELVFIVYYCLNYLFYTLLIVGFLCMKTSTKYI